MDESGPFAEPAVDERPDQPAVSFDIIAWCLFGLIVIVSVPAISLFFRIDVFRQMFEKLEPEYVPLSTRLVMGAGGPLVAGGYILLLCATGVCVYRFRRTVATLVASVLGSLLLLVYVAFVAAAVLSPILEVQEPV